MPKTANNSATINAGATSVNVAQIGVIAFAAMQAEIFGGAIVATGKAAAPAWLERGKLRRGTLIMLRLGNEVVTVYIMVGSAFWLLAYVKGVRKYIKVKFISTVLVCVKI